MYNDFAYYYDSLMYDVPYKKWVIYIEELFKKHSVSPKLIADLGCGTGSLLLEFLKRDYEMIGIDISEDMLNCTKTKLLEESLDAILLNQDMTKFELYGTADAFICTMDSINYIITKEKLIRMFKLVENYLNPGGVFIFDINTLYKFENKLAGEVFYDIGEDVSYIWQNTYDKNQRICTFDLTFFIKEDKQYNRFDEVHYEKAYTTEEIEEILKESNLEILEVYDELTLNAPKIDSLRIFYVVQKKS